MNTFQEVANNIKGRIGITENEFACLEKYLSQNEGDHLEIGTLWAGSAILAAKVLSKEYTVTTLDPMVGGFWSQGDPVVGLLPTFQIAHENLAACGVADRVKIHRIKHEQYEYEHPFYSIFIDGDHSYFGLHRDWMKAVEHKPQYIFLHDYDTKHVGVKEFVDKNVRTAPAWQIVEIVDSLVVVKRA